MLTRWAYHHTLLRKDASLAVVSTGSLPEGQKQGPYSLKINNQYEEKMSGKKTVSMIFKTLNYTNEIKKKSTNGHGGRRQLIKSLRHSLRIPASTPKQLEWLNEQSHLNLIWLPETGVIKLDDFSEEHREELLSRITDEAELPTVVNDNRSELLELRTKLKNKVKNASKQETNEATISAFQKILNVQGVAEIDELLTAIAQFEIRRKSQKLSTARQFLECHNEIERGPKPLIRKNQAVIQEAFFKFPSKNQVEGLSAEQRIKLIKDFYGIVFPDYPIHFVVLHGDEDADLTDHSDHPHIFISTKNSKTGRYDLRETQINKVNSYLKKHRPGTIPISEKPDFLESQLLFGYLQDMFYSFTNNRLLKATPYFARKNSKTERYANTLRFINDESRKAKSEREFSLYQLIKEKRSRAAQDLEQAQRQAAEAKEYTHKAKQYVSVQIAKAKDARESARDAEQRQKLAEEATEEEYQRAAAYQRRSDSFIQSLHKSSVQYDRMQDDIEKKRKQLKLFKTNLTDLIDGIMQWLDEFFQDKKQDLQELCLERARQAYARIRENDESSDGIFVRQAEEAIDQQLGFLDEYGTALPELPKALEIKRKIIKP